MRWVYCITVVVCACTWKVEYMSRLFFKKFCAQLVHSAVMLYLLASAVNGYFKCLILGYLVSLLPILFFSFRSSLCPFGWWLVFFFWMCPVLCCRARGVVGGGLMWFFNVLLRLLVFRFAWRPLGGGGGTVRLAPRWFPYSLLFSHLIVHSSHFSVVLPGLVVARFWGDLEPPLGLGRGDLLWAPPIADILSSHVVLFCFNIYICSLWPFLAVVLVFYSYCIVLF